MQLLSNSVRSGSGQKGVQYGIDTCSVNRLLYPGGELSMHSLLTARLIMVFLCRSRKVCLNNLVILKAWFLQKWSGQYHFVIRQHTSLFITTQ